MKNLNRFVFLFFISSSLSIYSQTSFEKLNITTSAQLLPEVLLNFDAIFDNKKVELTWSSNTENNNNFYSIEKSKDAISFETVSTIKSFGNHSNIISYFDVDFTPFDGISYYRLKQIDSEGKILSSRLVSINNKTSTNSFVMNQSAIFETSSNLMGSENSEILVVLRSEKGVESYSKVVIDEEHNIRTADSSPKLDNGVYTIVACSDNKLYSQKVVIK